MTGLSVWGAVANGGYGMTGYERYALYWAPDPGPLADFTAAWLGWDAAAGCAVDHPHLPGLPRTVAEITATPRIYGFHGTVKPPFRLAPGTDAASLHAAAAALCARLAPVTLSGLALHRLGGFVALTPEGDAGPLAALAADVVRSLDPFRAPPTEAEIARRRPDRLTDRQGAHLARWGYPYVMEDFQFHLTLTGDLPETEARAVATALQPVLDPMLPRPFRVDSLCLFGQGRDGMFRQLHRYALSG
jgi:putative phosphonate metabolism protein